MKGWAFCLSVKYGIESLRNGYQNNAFEVEARAAEGDQLLSSRYDLSDYGQFMQDGH
jgi:hypothetical protein